MENINSKVNNYDLAYNKQKNGEYQNSTINNEVETINFDNIENSMENINFNNEEYIKLVDEYKRNLKLQKEGYEKELEELDKTLAILEYKCGNDYREWFIKYKNKYDIDELIELSKELEIGNIENTKAYLEQLKQDKGILESAIYKIEQLDKTAEYDYLEFLDEYKNYEGLSGFSDEELNKIDFNKLFSKVYEGNLESYCNANGIDIDKINLEDFYDKAITEYEGGYKTYCQDTELANLYELGNEDIIKKYNYYLEKYGKEKASEFLTNMKDAINEQVGAKRASQYLSTLKVDENGNYDNKEIINYISTMLKGGGTGFNSFSEGLEAWFQKDHVYSTSEYETMYILQSLKENDNFTNILDNTFELSQSVGNMLPSMMIGAIATPLVGTITMGVSSGGNSYHSAMVNGSTRGQAITYGVLSGLSESTLQHFLGSIPGLNDVNVTSLKTYLQSIGKEGVEEFVQEYVDASLRESILQEEIDGNQLFWDSIKSFLYGAIISAGSNGINLASNTITENSSSEVKTVESNTTNETKSNPKNITGEIAKANYHTEKGRVCSIDIDGIESISISQLNMIKHPNSVSFRLPDGTFLSYNELLNLKNQTSINSNVANLIDIINNSKLKDLTLTKEQVDSLFLNIEEINLYIAQKGVIDSILQKMLQGEKLNKSTYDAIFNSKMFSGDSEFSKQYLYDTIVELGSPELAEIVKNTYEGARKATGKKDMNRLHSYCDHTESHVLQVAFESVNALNVINQSVENGNNGFGKYGTITEDEYKTIFVAGLAHDLGMAAGVFDEFGNPINPAVNSWLEKNANGVDLKSEVIKKDLKDSEKIISKEGAKGHVSDIVRGNHTLNSALAVLQNRTLFEKLGVNPDLVALLCFSHSKSNSGVVDLTSFQDWSFSVEKINDAVNTYNKENPNNKIEFRLDNLGKQTDQKVQTSKQKLVDKNKAVYDTKKFEFLDEYKQKLSTLGLSLRIGDAYVNKAKVILPKGQEVKWVYNEKHYSSNILVLTQSGVYMAYDPNSTEYFEKNLNTVDTESSRYGAFIYFKKNSDGTFTPWNFNESIVYIPNENGEFVIDDTNKDCLMSKMGDSEVKFTEKDGSEVKYKILDNGFYLIETEIKDANGEVLKDAEGKKIIQKDYYRIETDKKGNITLKEEITESHEDYDKAIEGSKISSTSGQFLAGESNVTYEFKTKTYTKGEVLVSEYKVGNIELFPYNTIDKGIVERVGEIATANDIERIADIVIDTSQFDKYFSIVDGEVVANSVGPNEKNLGKIYIEHILATKTKKDNSDIEFLINGYSIKD